MYRTPRRWLAVTLAGIAIVAGCTSQNEKPPVAQAPVATAIPAAKPTGGGAEHAHKPGAHQGIIVEIGRDNFHAEAVFETGGKLRLYTLGQDEAKVLEVEAKPLTAYAKAEGSQESVSFVLRPEPQAGDRPGMTSQFLGLLPRDLAGKRLEITIPMIRIGAERFRFGFKNVADDEHHNDAMPAKVADDDERNLYLTPGGKYTEADIAANGRMTASEKFKNVKAEHDVHPKLGDVICPISETKANPKITWIIGGKTYQFCCPPCIDEFLARAKQKPDAIKEPEAYRQK